MEYESLFKAARQAGTLLAETETERLGRTLMHAAQLLRTHTPRLLEANARDLEAMAPDSPLRDRLRLTPERIAAIAADMEAVAHLPSPQGEELERFFFKDIYQPVYQLVDEVEQLRGLHVDEGYKAFLSKFLTEAIAGILLDCIERDALDSRQKLSRYITDTLTSAIPNALETAAGHE